MIYMIIFSFIGTIFATFLGSLISLLTNNINKRILNFLNNFSLGIIIGFIFLELIKESIKLSSNAVNDNILGTFYSALIIVFSGLIFYLLHELIHKFSSHHHKDNDDKIPCLDHGHILEINKNSSLLNNIVFILAILIHNIPEGLSLGVSFTLLNNDNIPMSGIIMAIILFLHNLIIGFMMSNNLKNITNNKYKLLFVPLLTAFMSYTFALIGYFVTNLDISLLFNAIALSISSGSLLYVLLIELIPQNYYQYKDRFSFIYIILGVGICLILIAI